MPTTGYGQLPNSVPEEQIARRRKRGGKKMPKGIGGYGKYKPKKETKMMMLKGKKSMKRKG